MPIEVTDAAKIRIAELCKQHASMVRFLIESGGCQGFNQVWKLDTVINNDDQSFKFENDGWLVIDLASLDLIGNATIDYKTNFNGAYFTVDIPEAVSKCGCGTSFSV